jgi:glycine hydroxymethyltransferase
VDQEGYLTGQAYIDLKNAEEGTVIYIYQGAQRETTSRAPADLKLGDRATLPAAAVVVSRFP